MAECSMWPIQKVKAAGCNRAKNQNFCVMIPPPRNGALKMYSTRCPGGEIGRHRRLKISRLNGCTGSIPVPGTIKSSIICKIRRLIKFLKP